MAVVDGFVSGIFPGVNTSRDDVVVDIEKKDLIRRMEQYFDPNITHDEMRRVAPGVMASTKRFQAEHTRDYLLKRGFKPEFIIPYCYRPFDLRWVYWEPETKLLDEKRSDYVPTRGRWLPLVAVPAKGRTAG